MTTGHDDRTQEETAEQAVIPHTGEWAEHLYVFQRTPSSIDVKNNPPPIPSGRRR